MADVILRPVPLSHAASHQHGGSDEIATATPGANAIPKAGGAGTLAAGWIPDLSGTYQPLSAVLTNTTASFTTADETKLDGIETGAQVNTVASVAGKTGAVTLAAADIASGTLVHERGGLEADVSAYNGLLFISGGATSTKAIGTDVQAYDAGLAALAAFNTNGIVCQTADNTFAGRTITGTSNQVNVSNGNGVSGNPTLSLPQNIHTAATPQFAAIGLGAAAVSYAVILVSGGSTTGTTQIGASVAPTFSSSATGLGVAASTKPNLASASFTCTDLVGLYCDNPSAFSGGAAATNLTAVYIPDQTRGTNNYGIQLQVSSGANKWGIYASGTANNMTNGAWIFGQTTAPTLGSNQAAVYAKDVSGTAEIFCKDEAGNESQQSPHPAAVMESHTALMQSLGLAPLANTWGYANRNELLGVATLADLGALARCVEWLMQQAGRPVKLVHEEAFEPTATWDAAKPPPQWLSAKMERRPPQQDNQQSKKVR